jgi:hypothetical protein
MITKFMLQGLHKGEMNISPDQPAYPLLLVPGAENQNSGGSSHNHHMAFHFALWVLAHENPPEFGAMVDVEILDHPVENARCKPIWVLFKYARDRRRFQTWLKKYSKWFLGDDLASTYFPQLPRSGRYSLTHITIPAGLMTDFTTLELNAPNGSIERWIWVLQHCKRPVYVTPEGRGLAFTSQTEAMHFKLKWC